MRRRDHLLDGAVRQQHAIGDVGDLVTALGLVHVVGRDQHGQPCAASAWISFQNSRRALGSTPAVGSSSSSSCGFGSVQAPSASRCFQPPESSPASCSSRPREAEPLDHRARGRARVGEPIEARDEFQVLAHREILIEAEALGHVADMALDLVGLRADVVAEAGAVPSSGVSRPHSMRMVVVLPEPLGPRKP